MDREATWARCNDSHDTEANQQFFPPTDFGTSVRLVLVAFGLVVGVNVLQKYCFRLFETSSGDVGNVAVLVSSATVSLSATLPQHG
jgi:hypothetical protein